MAEVSIIDYGQASDGLLYLGLVFLFMVMYAPGGIASLIMMNLRVAAFGKLRRLWTSYLALGATALTVLLGAATMIEMVYHLQLNEALGPTLRFMGATLDASGVDSWFGASFVLLTGLYLAYYWYSEISDNTSDNAVLTGAGSWQVQLRDFISRNQTTIVVLASVVIAAAVAFAIRAKLRPQPE